VGEVERVDVRDEARLDAAVAYGSSAVEIIAGPRSLPPMPMLTTLTVLPVMPFHAPERTRSAKALMALQHGCTSHRRLAVHASAGVAGRRRSAVCSTARSSRVDVLAAEHGRIRSARCTSSARAEERDDDPSSTRFFDRSTCRSAASKSERSTRPGRRRTRRGGRARGLRRAWELGPGGSAGGVDRSAHAYASARGTGMQTCVL
jgi:hypothetical protein